MLKKIKSLWEKNCIFLIILKIKNNYYRKKLLNHNFTILCSNCIGGILYNRLGEHFNSPTVNLRLSNKDFCNFLQHFDYYINQDVTDNGLDKDKNPTGIIFGNGKDIPNIVIFFVHFKDFQDGRNKWNERKKRIRRDNLYIMMYDADGVTTEDLKKVEDFKCNNKVIFTPNKDLDVDWSFYINAKNNTGYLPEFYLLRNMFGNTRVERKFDFVSFLNKNSNNKKAEPKF